MNDFISTLAFRHPNFKFPTEYTPVFIPYPKVPLKPNTWQDERSIVSSKIRFPWSYVFPCLCTLCTKKVLTIYFSSYIVFLSEMSLSYSPTIPPFSDLSFLQNKWLRHL